MERKNTAIIISLLLLSLIGTAMLTKNFIRNNHQATSMEDLSTQTLGIQNSR